MTFFRRIANLFRRKDSAPKLAQPQTFHIPEPEAPKRRPRRPSNAERKADELIRVHGDRRFVHLQYDATKKRGVPIPGSEFTVASQRNDIIKHFATGAPLPWRFWFKGRAPQGVHW